MPMIVCGIFGQLFAPHDPALIQPTLILQPPVWLPGGDWTYFLGTDNMGRDLLSRLIEGARGSLIVSFCGVALSGFLGVTLGMVAGYFEGKLDDVIMRIVDIWMSIPPIILVLLFSAVLGPGLQTIILSIGLVFWTQYSRIIRGETLSIKQRDFVALAKVTGCGKRRILLKHIFPNLISTSMVLATLQLGGAVMLEAALSFLGLGIQPPESAWGLIISDGRIYMSTAWWIPTFAGLCIMITVLGANLFGDWLRDALDPKLRQV